MLAMLMPTRIEIVEPFTRVKSFDDDAVPDGIEVLIQAVNALDNPGVMVVGSLHLELYEYVPASADRKGRQLARWNVDLTTTKSQRTHWNRLTQMYEFRLGVDPTQISARGDYILVVTYSSPLGDHLTDEVLIAYRRKSGPLGGSAASGS